VTIDRFSADVDVRTVVDSLARNGACIVEALVDEEVMDRILEELEPFLRFGCRDEHPLLDLGIHRIGALIARSPAARPLAAHPLVLGAVRGVLDKTNRFQLNLTDLISVEPREKSTPQELHRDQASWEFPFPVGYEVSCGTMWALTEFTAENGATRIVPGSHLAPDEEKSLGEWTRAESEPAVMPRGSVVIYTGRLVHGAGSNGSKRVRRGLNFTYCCSWLRQEENQYLSVPMTVARELDDAMLRLIGYDRAGIGLGTYGDRIDPLNYVKPGHGTDGLLPPSEYVNAARIGHPELLMRSYESAARRLWWMRWFLKAAQHRRVMSPFRFVYRATTRRRQPRGVSRQA
jgi:ectoine hydroxylase-related dioxygenase (phytanoyl-CoA dioxygenase family)